MISDEQVQAEREQMQAKWGDRMDDCTDDRLERLADFATQVVVEELRSIEYLTVIEEAEATDFELTEEEAEFVHDMVTSLELGSLVEKALL